MMTRHLISLAKWAWIVILLVAVSYYVQRNFQDVLIELRKIEIWRLLLSSLLLLIGRMLIVQLARQAIHVQGYDFSYLKLFRMVGLSEVAKYLPGGIWHFVGRAGYYHSAGITVKDSSQALLLEHVWLVVSSALAGTICLLWFDRTLQSSLLSILLIASWCGLLWFLMKRFDNSVRLRPIVVLFCLQVMIWLSLGASYGVLIPEQNINSWVLLQGAFAISWLIGFLTIIAPGGLGTRELAITTLMLPLFPASTTLILASVHRLIWIGVEVLLGLIALLLRESRWHDTLLK